MSTPLRASHPLPLLQNVRVAAPCPMRWEDLTPTGDSHTRHCDRCNLNVHNLSGITAGAAEALLRSSLNPDGTAARVCAAVFRRADGTVLTADCPVGVAALRAKARRAAVRVAAAVGLTAAVSWAAARAGGGAPFAHAQPLTAAARALRGQPVLGAPSRMVMGDVGPSLQPPPPVLGWLPGGRR